ncbi:MAG: DNA polymerase III subunit chi [Burkholderiaceae bacterium]|jgi:DNA polymerase-3 subunit chi|nr:DNA polymerase III subunit chi [Burkholderiaceae bacterium]
MTEIAFHFNVGDPLAYACRLLRKAHGVGTRVTVVGPQTALSWLDQSLWSFSTLDFVPHCLADAPAQVRARTPIVLAEGAQAAPGHAPVLLNLGEDVPAGFEPFERLIELVGTAEADRQHARARWRHYAAHGHSITRHDLAASG